MATATAPPRLLREGADALLVYAARDLALLWREVTDAATARAALMDVLPALVTTYGAAAATLAADFYDDERERAGVRRRFTAIPVETSDRGAQALAGWATATAKDMTSLQSLVMGGIQRRVKDHSRLTIVGSSLEDPEAQGWVRVGYGECGWCQQYLDGAVHTVEGYDFDAHDNCRCDAIPAF